MLKSRDFTVVDDPIALFEEWQSEARDSEPNDPTAMALATVDPDGMPDLRMVLLKGMDRRGFVFYTNFESAKGREIHASMKAAALFHWKSLRRQIRIRGPVEVVTDAEADAYYASRPRQSRIGAWASQQSRPLESRAVLERAVADVEARYPDAVPRPPHWSGFRIKPLAMEFWSDGAHRLHDRVLFARTGFEAGWTRGAALSVNGSRLYPARPLLAASLAVFRDDCVLLAQRAAPPSQDCFTLPGGLVEPGETLEQAALREMQEEVGVTAAIIGFNRHVEMIERDAHGAVRHHYVIASFVGRWIAGEGSTGPEAKAVIWADRAALALLPTTPHLAPLLEAAWGDRRRAMLRAIARLGLILAVLAPTAVPAEPGLPTPPVKTQPTRPPPAAPALPSDAKPYDPQLMRLAEMLGALTYLRGLCGDKDAATWQKRMQVLLDAEGTTPPRRDRLAGAYNRGVEGYQLSYRQCTVNAQTIIDRFLADSAAIAKEVENRFGAT